MSSSLSSASLMRLAARRKRPTTASRSVGELYRFGDPGGVGSQPFLQVAGGVSEQLGQAIGHAVLFSNTVQGQCFDVEATEAGFCELRFHPLASLMTFALTRLRSAGSSVKTFV